MHIFQVESAFSLIFVCIFHVLLPIFWSLWASLHIWHSHPTSMVSAFPGEPVQAPMVPIAANGRRWLLMAANGCQWKNFDRWWGFHQWPPMKIFITAICFRSYHFSRPPMRFVKKPPTMAANGRQWPPTALTVGARPHKAKLWEQTTFGLSSDHPRFLTWWKRWGR